MDLEEVDQEVAADEATQSSATKTDAPEDAPANEAPESAPDGDACADDDVIADAWTWSFRRKTKPPFFFVCVPIMFCKSNLIVSFILICFENNIGP